MSDETPPLSAYYMPGTNDSVGGRFHLDHRGDIAMYLRSDPGMCRKELNFYGDLFAKAIDNMGEWDREKAAKLAVLSGKQQLVEEIRRVCTENYENGGDEIIETMSDEEIAAEFSSVQEVKEYCGMRVEDATNHRWGEDTDPELVRSEKFKNWKDE